MGVLRIWWADSRGKVIVVLLVLWIATLIHQFTLLFLLYPLSAVAITVTFDVLLTQVKQRKEIFSLSSVVTGLLIGLISDPKASAPLLIFACAVAALSKQFLAKGSHKHIFNPAALGMVAASVFSGRPISWWVASWGSIPLGILVIGMVPVLFALRRIWTSLVFLIVYFFILAWALPFAQALRLTLDGTVFLFVLVMLPEPITSVARGWWRYIWGIGVGALLFVGNMLHVTWSDPLLLSLLEANLVGFFLVRMRY